MNLWKGQELQIDNYLGKLRESLPNMSVAEREEIVREISVHFGSVRKSQTVVLTRS